MNKQAFNFITAFTVVLGLSEQALANNAPTIANLDGDNYIFTEGDGQTLMDQGSAATLTDIDSADFDTGNLTVMITSGAGQVEDLLSVRTGFGVSLPEGTTAGSNVDVGGVIGTLANDIASDENFVVNLNSSATPAKIQTLIRELTYENTHIGNPTTGARNISLTVDDGDGGTSAIQNITITVVASNNPPNTTADADSTNEDNAVIVDVLNNDSDAEGSLNTASVRIDTAANNGETAVNTTTGAITYTPNANFNGVDNFSYTVADNTGLVSTATSVTITINAQNDKPEAIADTASTVQNTLIAINVAANDTDIDSGDNPDPTSIAVVSAANHGSAIFNNSTNHIDYTPNNGFTGIDTFTYTIDDISSGASSNEATVTVTVTAPNMPPTSANDMATMDEDSLAIINVLANDSDIDGSIDASSINIVSNPTKGSTAINASNGVITYTPNANYNGNDSFTYTVNDDEGAVSNPATVSLTISAVNDQPEIVGVPTSTATEGINYNFTPTANDIDVGDELVFSIAGKPSWANFNTATGTLTGVPKADHIGLHNNIIIRVSDNKTETSLAAFSIEVVAGLDSDKDGISDYQETIDGTDPNDAIDYKDDLAPELTPPDTMTIDATGTSTSTNRAQLLGLAADASEAAIQTVIDTLVVDNIEGIGCCDIDAPILRDNDYQLAPGRNKITWRTTDSKGNVSEATQIVNVRPLVSLSNDQMVPEDSTRTITVFLNGKSPTYPLEVPFVIDERSTIDPSEHDLVNGSVIFQQGETTQSITVRFLGDAIPDDNEILVVRLDDRTTEEQDGSVADIYDINSGIKNSHTIHVVETNLPPEVNLSISQNSAKTLQITNQGGNVLVQASVIDESPTELLTFNWSTSDNALVDNDGDTNNANFIFDPSGLAKGRYRVTLSVADNEGAEDVAISHFIVVAALPILSPDEDTDGDGIDDQTEGTSDSDGDGIPDYLDNNNALLNIIPSEPAGAADTGDFLIECEPGVRCRLGQFALIGVTGGARLSEEDAIQHDDLIVDPDFEPIGGIFDFELHDLPIAGEPTRIVIPQIAAIPPQAAYRKFQHGSWVPFVESDKNLLHSSQGSLGFCPPPGDAAWVAGLIEGYYCVQLTIEDGGPNDADGFVNGTVADPGAVSIARNSGSTASKSKKKSSGSVAWLLVFTLFFMFIAREKWLRC